MASNPIAKARETLPRKAKSLSHSSASSMPSTSGKLCPKASSSNLKATHNCLGCDTKVQQINKHLAWKPECRKFYDENALKMVSIESRRESRKKYDLAHQKEIKSKKATSYKTRMQGNIKIQQPEKHGSNATRTTHSKMPDHLKGMAPADFHTKNICSICEKQFSRQDKLTRHLKEVHEVYKNAGKEKSELFLCPSCNETFSRKETLMRHIQDIHKKSSHTCSVCNKEFSRKDALERHIQEIHDETKKFRCPDCPLSFSRKDIFDSHVKRAAINGDLHGCIKHCGICKKDILFPSKKAYKNHSWGNGCRTLEAERDKRREAWAN